MFGTLIRYLTVLSLTMATAWSMAFSLSVEDAVRLAVSRNPDVAAARNRLEQAKSRERAARALMAPHLGLQVEYLRGDAPSAFLVKRIDGRQFPSPPVDFNAPGGFSNLEAGLTLSLPLWDAGRGRYAQSAARSTVHMTSAEKNAVLNELIGGTIQAYFDVISAKEYVIVADQSLESVTAQLEELRIRHSVGEALRTDVLGLEVRKAAARERLIAARNGKALAWAAFRQLIDEDDETQLVLSGDEWAPSVLPSSLEKCIEASRRNRPEYSSMTHALEKASHVEQKDRSEMKPRVDFVGRAWAGDKSGSILSGRTNWTVGAQVSWDISDGGRRRNALEETRERQNELYAVRRSLERSIDLQVRQAFLALDEARARHEVARTNTERAEESLELVRRQFEGGTVTVTQYLQTEAERTEARFREVRSRYDVIKARAALGHAIGLCWIAVEKWNKE